MRVAVTSRACRKLANSCLILPAGRVGLLRARDAAIKFRSMGQQQIDELSALLRKHAPDGAKGLPVPRATIKVGTCRTGPAPGIYEPMMGFLLQGTKRVTVGSRTFVHSGASFMVASL